MEMLLHILSIYCQIQFRVNNITAYNLRNGNDFEIPFSRLCSYENSYFPSTLKLWYELDQQVRTLPTISRFKSNIKTIPDKIPDYTSVGERKYNIMQTRIRHRSSSLKADLYGVNIIPSSACSCGAHNYRKCRPLFFRMSPIY